MKILSNLFIKKFDYVAFSIGIITLLLIILNFFKGFSSFNLYNHQISIVILYYFLTRGRAEQNLKSQGIEPIITSSVMAFIVVIVFMANIIIIMDLK